MQARKTIAIVIDPDWPVKRHYEVIAGIQRYAAGNTDWKLVSDLFPEGVLERYDAVVGRITNELAQEASRIGIPVVNTWFSSTVKGVASVYPDFEAAARMAADHLISRGFRSFAYVGVPFKSHRFIRDCFRDYLNSSGYSFSSITVSNSYNMSSGNWRRFSDKLGNWVNSWSTPIGVFAGLDSLNRNLVGICEYRDIAIPQQAALIGLHNEPIFCLLSEPTLTSIDLGFKQIGFRAAMLLDDLLQGKKPPEQPILLQPDYLVPRKSTDTFASRDPQVTQAIQFMFDHYREAIDLSDIAATTGISKSGLYIVFRKDLGRTPIDILTNIRLNQAKHMLRETNHTVDAIATDCGFGLVANLYHHFKQSVGMPPTAYRKQTRP